MGGLKESHLRLFDHPPRMLRLLRKIITDSKIFAVPNSNRALNNLHDSCRFNIVVSHFRFGTSSPLINLTMAMISTSVKSSAPTFFIN